MATPASTTQSAHPLAHLSGTILLAGAGKMGSALLEGWLHSDSRPEISPSSTRRPPAI